MDTLGLFMKFVWGGALQCGVPSDCFSLFYSGIMTNTRHDFGLCTTVDGFSKVQYVGIPMVRQLSFAFKGRRKQEYKEIGSVGGMTQVVECLPRKSKA
jgi:hypothetical protein